MTRVENHRRDRVQDAANSSLDITLAGAAAATLGMALMDGEAVARENQLRANVPDSIQNEREHAEHTEVSDHPTSMEKEASATNPDYEVANTVAVRFPEAEAEHRTIVETGHREAVAIDRMDSVDEPKYSESQDSPLLTSDIGSGVQSLPGSVLTQAQDLLSDTVEAVTVNLQSAMSHVSSAAGNLLQGIEERLESVLSFEPLIEFAVTDVTSQIQNVLSGNPAALMLEGALQDASGAQIDSVFHSAFGAINDFAPEIVSTVEGSIPLPVLAFVGQPLPALEGLTHPDHGLLNGLV